MIAFQCDYATGAHPLVLDALIRSNLQPEPGYGDDSLTAAAAAKIRKACEAPDAEVRFLCGGTQTNQLVIDVLLRPYEGVFAAETGHVATHEAGAIEFGGHKVLTLPEKLGKMNADDLRESMRVFTATDSRAHMVQPRMVYLSQPTEYGTLYTLAELTALRAVCDEYGLLLYADGARLADALAADNDVKLPDLYRLCDAFYIGGTKCGALCGEALVMKPASFPAHFLASQKQHGALMAKGRVCGAQFDALFTDGLYEQIGRHALDMAEKLKALFRKANIPFFLESPTNQQFVILTDAQMEALQGDILFDRWGPLDEGRTICRFVTAWSTEPEHIAALEKLLGCGE